MTSFVSHITHDLSQRIVQPANAPSSPVDASESPTKDSLRAAFLSINQSASLQETRRCLESLRGLETQSLTQPDEEEIVLRRVVLGKVAVELYGRALSITLEEAMHVEDELEWWADVERSSSSVGLYLLQTFPSRIVNFSNTILAALQKRHLPLRPSTLKPSSLRQLFPSNGVLRPNALAISLFPHLHYQPYSIALTIGRFPSASAFAHSPRRSFESAFSVFAQTFVNLARGFTSVALLPLELTRGECRFKHHELRRLRDQKAETLGTLSQLRDLLASGIEEQSPEQGLARIAEFAAAFQLVVKGESVNDGTKAADLNLMDSLEAVAVELEATDALRHVSEMKARNLTRPSRLTLLWPRLVLLPPLVLYLIQRTYASRYSLHQMAVEAFETARGFWEDWLLNPLKGVVNTVRARADGGMIVNRESVKADLDSLERMALALAKEKLNYDAVQMAALSQQIQLGDLTTVMQIYEDDIKNPLKSAVGGTLLRTLFIQVQKAKVDIDQALSGIDKLLKSQELTFAFVGVAPALAIVYAFAGYLRSIWVGGRGRGRYGGQKWRARVWLKVRRIERLLIAQPQSTQGHIPGLRETPQPSIPPLTSGLLLLSVSHLRTYAEQCLPANSRLREGFLEDVTDLEDSALGRAEKLRVLDRMWRCWGGMLGWRKMVGGAAGG
ncbi:NCA2-domain-containing protein [Laetiporus sulphureus 93-53]|uniref:NCA2-domain-containing protein n=1 Tax=Laetiporus sulphureus 93-53 TaxID=1314785 RepID=A0A165HM68_9APHY|nr:NCA2-domain-containing protein [Laetiporus sulphureus 93-53]KZT11917.1 NCA2-domain-containing protein [Laetiporus sulphureus 93-53]